MKKIGEMTHGELAAFIQTKLRERSIDVVLSGGAAVTIYTTSKYVSDDLDLVIMRTPKRKEIREVMEQLGFQYIGRHFEHPETDLFVRFPPGPLTIGDVLIEKIVEMKLSTGVLRVISPTDSAKDRLSAYFHWNDRQSLEQAILIAKDNQIDLDNICKWSKAEGNLAKYENFISRL